MQKVSFGVQEHRPPWSPEPGALRVSPMWAASSLLSRLGHCWCRLTGAWGRPAEGLPVRSHSSSSCLGVPGASLALACLPEWPGHHCCRHVAVWVWGLLEGSSAG